MKVRNGFVSNSSSSSFLVEIVSWDYNQSFNRTITAAQEKKLIKHGYQYTNINTPGKLEAIRLWTDTWPMITDKEPGFEPLNSEDYFDMSRFLGFGVICNQDDEIEWLVKNKIPFRASVHSNHETVIFDGKNLWQIQNPGVQNEFRGPDEFYKDDLEKLKSIGFLKKTEVKNKTQINTPMR